MFSPSGCFVHRMFCPKDLLSLRMFCLRFFFVYSKFCLKLFCLRTFCPQRCYVLGCFVYVFVRGLFRRGRKSFEGEWEWGCSDVSSPDDTSLVGSTRIVYPVNFSFPISFVPWCIHPMDGWSHWFFRSCPMDVMTLQGRFTPTIPERSDILSRLFQGCIVHFFC